MGTITIPHDLSAHPSPTQSNGCGPPSPAWPTALLPEFVTGSPFGTSYVEVCVTPPANLDGAGHSCSLHRKELGDNDGMGTIHMAGPQTLYSP